MNHRRAFTLLEVMLALALIVLLLLGVISLQWAVGDSRDRIMTEARRSQAIGGMVERLENDLMTSIAGDPTLGAGVKGEATGITVLSRGVWLAGPDESRRAGAERVAAGAFRQQGSDLIGTRYELVAAGAGGGGGVGGGAAKLMVRRWLAGPGTDAPPESAMVSDEVETVRFRYFDGRTWRDDFDSLQASGLPAAVEVAVWMARAPSAKVGSDDAPKPALPMRAPDRVRVIGIPDGSVPAGGGL